MQNTKGGFRQKPIKTFYIFTLISLLIFGFVIYISKIILGEKDFPSRTSTIYDRGLRGSIISKDGYTLSKSSKTYQATIFTQSLNPNKKELFIKLFSIYSGIDAKKIQSITNKHHGYTVLAKNLDQASATRLKSLAYKLRRLNVFVSIKNRNGMRILYGLDIVENGEIRHYPLGEILSPALGYIKKIDNDNYVRLRGIKGIEKKYQKYLDMIKNGYTKGIRDVGGTIILNNKSITMYRQDGMNIHLNILLALQRRVELILSDMQQETDAKEIIAGIMDSKNGKIIALASSNRYNPEHIKSKDISKLDPKFGEFLYEPGSVIKPITLSIALEHKVVSPNEWFDTKGGRLNIGGKYTIKDDEVFDSQTVTDIIVHSSNVGISKIVWRLTGKEFYDGMKKFGFGQISGIDLSKELAGKIKTVKQLSKKLDRANQSYGYGMYASFSQLLKAYSAFNNDGTANTPQIVDYLETKDGKIYHIKPKIKNLHPISKSTANTIKKILIEVVNRGTGKAAKYFGLEIGGKTGTAQIVKNRKYIDKYNSSFYGFANDKYEHKYTIGVVAIGLTKHHMHFASQSAVPIFKKIVDSMVDLGYLKPDLNTQEEKKRKDLEKVRKRIIREKKIQRAQMIKAKLKREREKIRKSVRKIDETRPVYKIQKYHPIKSSIPKQNTHMQESTLDLF